MIIKVCPKCGSIVFSASAHVVQTWQLDEFGNYMDVLEDATDVTHRPADDDIWTCDKCGHEDAGSAFNVEVPDNYNTEDFTDEDSKYIGFEKLRK